MAFISSDKVGVQTEEKTAFTNICVYMTWRQQTIHGSQMHVFVDGVRL